MVYFLYGLSPYVTTHHTLIKTNYYIELLREKIEHQFSETITISKTNKLSDDIYTKLKTRISATTLQRFFELITNKSQPSNHTINVLSEYVGYSSWDDLKNQEDYPIPKNEKISTR